MTVSFSIQSHNINRYYSTAGNSRADFIEKLDVTNYPENGEVPEVWTEFSVQLPEGAKYFAICHNSYDTYALFVDDVTYEAASPLPEDLEIQGYYIYCDGEVVNGEPHGEESYLHAPLADDAEQGSYKFGYAVATVYNHGVARACDEVDVSLEYSGIEIVGADSLDVANARYYDLQGRRVASGNLGDGVYIEVSGEQVRKIMIKSR